jgi:hypothetical protein
MNNETQKGHIGYFLLGCKQPLKFKLERQHEKKTGRTRKIIMSLCGRKKGMQT